MAGFAVLFEADSTPQDRENDFNLLLEATARYKCLELPNERAIGRGCTAVKLDAPSSLHRGIVHDEPSGSWLIAAGTIVTLVGNNDPISQLDTLLKDYLEQGINFLEHCDGHFALAIYDGPKESLLIISDATGQFSIFHARQGNKIFVSTSALAIAKLIISQPDNLAIENYLRTGNILGERTLWQDVKRVLPAMVIKYQRNNVEQFEYWTPSVNDKVAQLPFDDALDSAFFLITQTFKIILQREGKVWTDLTGGLDSRLTNMVMSKAGLPFTSYCVGPADHPDVQISNLVSQKMGWEYQHMQMPDDWAELQIKWLDTALYKGDAYISLPALATVLFGQQERSAMHKVIVTGLGADEWREASFPSTFFFNWGKEYKYDRLFNANIFSPIPESALRLNQTKLVREEWKVFLAKILSPYANYPNFIKGNLMFIRYRYPSHGGAYMSAASGIIRSISPFCFKELVNFGVSLDFKWRFPYHESFFRSLLARENLPLANIEIAKGGPAIPIKLTNIHKFWPLYKPIIRRSVNRVSSKLLGNSRKLWKEQSHYSTYPFLSWRTELIDYYRVEGLLNPAKMNSGSFYNGNILEDLAKQVINDPLKYSVFLDKVVSIEMAMRATGASIG